MFGRAIADVEVPMLALGASELKAYEARLPVRQLACNDILFAAGDIKTSVYRIEAGVLCLYATRPDGTHEVIEYALAGDIVGMGFLERHACTARATVGTRVRCIPLSDADKFIGGSVRAQKRYDAAMRREFASRRDSLVAAGRDKPVSRLASYLVAASRRNSYEGRDPSIVDGAVDSSIVAESLGCTVELLALAFANLEMQGLVQPAPNRNVRLTNMNALEAVAAS